METAYVSLWQSASCGHDCHSLKARPCDYGARITIALREALQEIKEKLPDIPPLSLENSYVCVGIWAVSVPSTSGYTELMGQIGSAVIDAALAKNDCPDAGYVLVHRENLPDANLGFAVHTGVAGFFMALPLAIPMTPLELTKSLAECGM